jgi:hypothetical protein
MVLNGRLVEFAATYMIGEDRVATDKLEEVTKDLRMVYSREMEDCGCESEEGWMHTRIDRKGEKGGGRGWMKCFGSDREVVRVRL